MGITILDGGMGQELVRRVGQATSLWSIKALLDDPDLVRAVHDDFFAAGAEVATTNSYSVLPDRLKRHGLGDRLEELSRSACEIACRSRDAHGSGLVAGSLGPLGFSYQPDKAPPPDEAAEIYARLARLHDPFVDIHLLETMSSLDQARGALMGAGVTGKPVWLAFSVDDLDGGRLRSGEPLASVAALIDEFRPACVLLNCSRPEAITAGLSILSEMPGPFGAYANGFTGIADAFDHIGATVDLLQSRTDLGPAAYAKAAEAWAAAGATVIGGCCEVGPDHIAELARRLKAP
ncbi:homocysteine S-methyltransferase family protein [Palleronia sp. LCG004]|uniref:homocysteine S-methyltransferase family protein n=1 Tax=Palleronia sp. LCG004 TaxID=3079304 RepID=UPI0029436A11|nr:homocysteine S-methyltransferase family protein [Palleronia sp. LCG004]WOI58258.1 homocysteine S-methyltransferase family protein [Palleronia sp. LCG004]